MNSLIQVLTQKIASDFLTDREAVALGNTNHNILRQLLGSHYRVKRRIDYQIIADRSAGYARLCEMKGGCVEYGVILACKSNIIKTVARSQTLTFSTPHEEGSQSDNDEKEEKGEKGEKEKGIDTTRITEEEDDRTPHAPPLTLTLTFTQVDSPAMIAQNSAYHIGVVIHLRLARSADPRKPITELEEDPFEPIDSENDGDENEWYEGEKDDGRKGRPELADFDFLPSNVKHLEVSKTILLSPQVTMSKLHRVESLTLGVLWPWHLTSTSAASYWPPQLKRLKFKRWMQDDDDNDDYETAAAADDNDVAGRCRFFGEISQITFPSHLTELELPFNLPKYKLFVNETKSNQLIDIQYPAGLTKLIHPFIPDRLAGWHLPKSLIHLECHFIRQLSHDCHHDMSTWQLPSSLLTLVLTASYNTKLQFSSLQLPVTLTSLSLPFRYLQSFELLVLPATLTQFNSPPHYFAHDCTFPLDWSHTQISSFTVHAPKSDGLTHQPLSTFSLPSTVTRIEFSGSNYLSRVPASYIWPNAVREVKLNLDIRINAPDTEFVLPPTIRSLMIDSLSLSGSFAQLKLPEGLESLNIRAYDSNAPLSGVVLPSSLTEFIFDNGSCVPIPELSHTRLIRLELLGHWSKNSNPITRDGFRLPQTLKSLRFKTLTQSLDQLQLPPGLTELRFDTQFNHSLSPLVRQIPQLRILTLPNDGFTHLSSLMDLHLPSSLSDLTIPSPTSKGIVLSPFHTRYTDFVTRLYKRLIRVTLINVRAEAKYKRNFKTFEFETFIPCAL